jgi:hypothetical protein
MFEPDYSKYLDRISFSEKAEKSLKEMSNWVLGISLGMCSLLLFKANEFDMSKYLNAINCYKIVVIFSLLTVFMTGLSKYLILRRESRLNIAYGMLLKLLYIQKDILPIEEFKTNWNDTFVGWTNEHNKLNSTARILKISTFMSFISVVSAAIFIFSIL